MAVDKLVDSTQLDSDLTSVANAIRTRGGTSSQLAFPNGFVSAVGAIGNQYSAGDEGKVVSSGALVSQTSDSTTQNGTFDTTLIDSFTVNVSGSTQYPYVLGGFYSHNIYNIEARENHVKITAKNSIGNSTIGLRDFATTTCPLWFTINAGDTYEIKFYNVVNAGGALWNANAKKANSNTSLSFGLGSNAQWLSGATVSGTQVSTAEIGCWFVYVSGMANGDVLEFDMSIKVNGTRIL